jgi:hypothetical protein
MPSPDFTPNNVWASTAPTGKEEEVTTPNGQTCRAKRMSIDSMIAEGLLAEADAITAQVTKHMRKIRGAKGKPDSDTVNVPSLMKDPKAVTELITMLDRLIPHIVVSPVVRLHYTETLVGKTKVTKMIAIEDREEGIVYTDQLGLEDKMFLFDWAAGGLNTMLAFRE